MVHEQSQFKDPLISLWGEHWIQSPWVESSNPTGSNFLLLDSFRYHAGKPLMSTLPFLCIREKLYYKHL